tara:strand:+ start:69 stop:254 length:186 start_codon:yes stop_codon:yes gene_type:complete
MELRACMLEAGYSVKQEDLAEFITGVGVNKAGDVDANEILQVCGVVWRGVVWCGVVWCGVA